MKVALMDYPLRKNGKTYSTRTMYSRTSRQNIQYQTKAYARSFIEYGKTQRIAKTSAFYLKKPRVSTSICWILSSNWIRLFLQKLGEFLDCTLR
jgi:hypothetical protein